MDSILNFMINLSFEQRDLAMAKLIDKSNVSVLLLDFVHYAKLSYEEPMFNKILSLLDKSENLPEAKNAQFMRDLIAKLPEIIQNNAHNNIVKFIVKQSKQLPRCILLECIKMTDSATKALSYYLTNNVNNNCEIVQLNNSIILLTTLVETSDTYLEKLNPIIPVLALIIKEKTGVLRKSAAILLAKLCKEPQNLSKARELHAIDVLMSLINKL